MQKRYSYACFKDKNQTWITLVVAKIDNQIVILAFSCRQYFNCSNNVQGRIIRITINRSYQARKFKYKKITFLFYTVTLRDRHSSMVN